MKNTIIILILGLIILGGCMPINNINYKENFDPNVEIKATKFSSDSELSSFLKERQSSYERGYEVMDGLLRSTIDLETAAPRELADKSTKEVKDFSQTNVQVEGIDEADIIKTDGNYIYIVQGDTLFIVETNNHDDAKIIYTETFKNNPQYIFVNDNKLAVMGYVQDSDFLKTLTFSPTRGLSFMNIYDITNKENPKLEKEFKFDGNIFQSRMKGDYMYVVTNTYNTYTNPRPIIMDGRREIPIQDIYYFNIPYNNPNFVNIYSININNFNFETKSVVMDTLENLYMSDDNIFISHTQNINEYEFRQEIMIDLIKPMLVPSDIKRIEKIENTDDDILNKYEKQAKIMEIIQAYYSMLNYEEQRELEKEIEKKVKEKLEEYEYMQYTVIHKININRENINIDVTGKVPGRLLNQFSMDEHNGILRVGTTVDGQWNNFKKERTLSTNHVFTLDNNLKIIGSLNDLAEDESIYSTRFIEDRLYMVTFRQIDPFFVIDLSDPKNIKNLGELKIPGFSRYLHPYDEDTIIGIGQEADENTGRQLGLKISLFDVSDVSDPKEIVKFIAEGEYSSSAAEYEHKAFLFSKEKNLLVIPVNSYTWRNQAEGYAGAFVFNISKDDIHLRGLIDHSRGQQYPQGVERSLYIDNILYTKSFGLLRSNDLNDLSSVRNITLESESVYNRY
jgi:inhibitor of cysteine peptidase